MRRRYAIPFIVAVVITVFSWSIAQQSYSVDVAGSSFYTRQPEINRAMYLMGYKTAIYAYNTALYESRAIGPLPDHIAYVYRMLGSVTAYSWNELDNILMAYYNTNSADIPVWQVLASHVPPITDDFIPYSQRSR